MTRLIIAGGGLAGGLAALALAGRADVELLLLEQAAAFGGNHSWSFFDTDVTPGLRPLVAPLIAHRWPDHEVRFPRRRRTIGIGYNTLRSADLDRALKTRLRPDQYRLDAAIERVEPGGVVLADGERLAADAVIDARGGSAGEGLALAWQKFVGRIYRVPSGHGVTRPMIMDATVDQIDGYRFVYLLPFTADLILAEDTYYSTSPVLDGAALDGRLDAVMAGLGRGAFEAVERESGVLPVVLDGDFDRFWPANDPVPRLGVRGGFFHPTTSYSLPDALANAAWLAGQRELGQAALAAALRRRARALWDERGFFRLLNRMLFEAAEPHQAYRVLEHFYRLPAEQVGRFYAARMRPWDKLRVLSGRPPVPVGRALKVIRGQAA